MEFRIAELTDEINEKLDLISKYLDDKSFKIEIKEIKPEPDVLPHEIEIKKDANKRRSGGIAGYSNGIIKFSPLSSQMIWYIAWLAFLIKEDKSGCFDRDDFIKRLIEVDKGENKDMTCTNLDEWDNKDLNSIFLYAMCFIICHELGHGVYHHPSPFDENFEMRDPALLKTNELEADSFAAKCVQYISNSNESELAVYGIIVAQIAILFIRDKEVTYVTHPDPDTRLRNSLNGIDLTPRMKKLIEKAKDLSAIYVSRRFV